MESTSCCEHLVVDDLLMKFIDSGGKTTADSAGNISEILMLMWDIKSSLMTQLSHSFQKLLSFGCHFTDENCVLSFRQVENLLNFALFDCVVKEKQKNIGYVLTLMNLDEDRGPLEFLLQCTSLHHSAHSVVYCTLTYDIWDPSTQEHSISVIFYCCFVASAPSSTGEKKSSKK